jgi:YHS domain-containing protein
MSRLICLVMLGTLVGMAIPAWADPASSAVHLPELTDVRYEKCPITGRAVRDEFAAVHEGKVFHFCSAGCVETFKKNPASIIAKIDGARSFKLNLINRNGTCPVTGKPAKPELFLVRGSTVTFYCCPECVGKDDLAPAPVELVPPKPGADGSESKPGSGTPESEKPADCDGDCSNCPGCPGS